LKKFDMDAYTKRRIQQLCGHRPFEQPEDGITQYTQRRMRELAQSLELERELDKSLLGCYTVSTMGDHDGES